jgi:tetratricopeptide (TPR) repeat protein
LFAEAVRIDSTFAAAWAARSVLWTWISDAYVAPTVGYPRARDNAARALRLDSTSAMAWSSESSARAFYDWDPHGALDAATRAVRINPREPDAQFMVAVSYALLGDTTAAVAAFERAFDLDSLDGRLAVAVPLFLTLFAGRSNEAMQIARRVSRGPLQLPFSEPRVLFYAGDCEAALGLALKERPGALSERFFKCPDPGPEAVAAADSTVARDAATKSYLSPWSAAYEYLLAGDVNKALPWLERALMYREWPVRFGWFNIAKLPRMDVVMSDPRLETIRQRAESARPPVP